MLRFENLGKRYGKHVLFHGLNYTAGNGCVALCDENGSGKTTLLAILAAALDADEGEVWLAGHSLRTAPLKAKAALAYVPEDCMDYPQETGRAFLELVASARNTTVDSHALDLANRFGLVPHLDKRFEQMSLGTRKKLFLTATLIGAPAVVIADEPGNGLDAPARAVLIDLFKTLAADRTVFFSSHDLALARACEATMISFADM
ncbi:ATP-binding cassette domain-containing protein [Paraburkholderia bannensis]|uniref:ATP-binding cassette domain-containing protein n=1 Tax=Paraburkholderia bannensis TaxID=765414 RepID=UPI002ABD3BB6|nr:ATP-binding cassette domain-containing protein [Paraburkholderia bannensis]